VVRVGLTGDGERVVQRLTRAHLERLHELAGALDSLVAERGAAASG
jgi:hypothetical protein